VNLDPKGGPPGIGRKDDKPRRKDCRDADNSKGKRKSDKFDRIGNIDKEYDSSYGGAKMLWNKMI